MAGSEAGTARRIWTPSNLVTITRILLVPVFVAALLTPWPEWIGLQAEGLNEWKSVIAAAIFVLISGTDWLDGYLARSRGEVTDFGKFMDPLADKILVTAALISLVELGSLPTWVVLVILAREFIVSGVRMMAATKGVVIAASMLGKFKTVLQMIAIVLFTIKDSHMVGSLGDALSDVLWVVSWLVMIAALVLTVASMIDYLYKAREIIGLGGGNVDTADDGSPGAAELARAVVDKARAAKVKIATAESLTGGMIGAAITSAPGSSEVFVGGVMSYVDEVKRSALGVHDDSLREDGAVSERVACEMARGARERLGADCAVSVTGIAGPGGAEPGKPVGTVWMGICDGTGCRAHELHFSGDRASVREQTTKAALSAILDVL